MEFFGFAQRRTRWSGGGSGQRGGGWGAAGERSLLRVPGDVPCRPPGPYHWPLELSARDEEGCFRGCECRGGGTLRKWKAVRSRSKIRALPLYVFAGGVEVG